MFSEDRKVSAWIPQKKYSPKDVLMPTGRKAGLIIIGGSYVAPTYVI